MLKSVCFLVLLAVALETKSEEAATASVESVSGNYAPATAAVHPGPAGVGVPVPGAVPPGIPGGFPGLLGGFPGFGFSKQINAGLGWPLLGGLFGGVPPPPVDAGPLPPVGPGIPPPPVGLVGPSYIPGTWLGSALSAKGDLLFPIVIIVFFIVGVWTVINFLLAVIVPLIAAKIGLVGSVVGAKKALRNVAEPFTGVPPKCKQSDEELAANVTDAIARSF